MQTHHTLFLLSEGPSGLPGSDDRLMIQWHFKPSDLEGFRSLYEADLFEGQFEDSEIKIATAKLHSGAASAYKAISGMTQDDLQDLFSEMVSGASGYGYVVLKGNGELSLQLTDEFGEVRSKAITLSNLIESSDKLDQNQDITQIDCAEGPGQYWLLGRHR